MGKKDDPDGEALRRLIRIDHKTDSMEDSLAWLVSANSPGLKEQLINAFSNGMRRVQIYLALNGKRNVQGIATHLHMKISNVSAELKWLKKRRLIDVLEAGNGGKKYKKKFFDAIVGLSDALMQKFGLDEHGNKTK
jgi:DNA-binding transcriptional ArsR family regulator